MSIGMALGQGLTPCWGQTLGLNHTGGEVGDVGLLLTSLFQKALPSRISCLHSGEEIDCLGQRDSWSRICCRV